jgi:heavy metal sensor kinase
MRQKLRSFRWQILSWYSLLLLLVLVAFCSTAVFLDRQTTSRLIDQQLRSYALERIGQLRREANPDRSGHLHPLHGSPPPADRRAPLDDEIAARPWGSPPYHIVWNDGEVIAQSDHVPRELAELPPPRITVESFRTREHHREFLLPGPRGLRLLVGRDIRHELAHAHLRTLLLAGAGAAVLFAGIAGGWWIANRAIRPIVSIGTTAEKIAAGSLRERIDASHFATEFGPLARTLNHTFDRLQSTLLRQVQFTADASHELRTPVSVSLLASQSALSRERPAAEYREALDTCQRAAQRMRHLVEQLLLLARLDAHDEQPRFQSVELQTVVTATVDLLQPLAAKHGVTIETALTPQRTLGDAGQLAQVVTNLVSNAIHHSPSGATVRVGLAATAGAVALTVTDRGEGIAPTHLPHIFERFYRADPSRGRADGRMGLGLAISQAIVESHGGRIDVVSQLGEGSTFTVTLPTAATS